MKLFASTDDRLMSYTIVGVIGHIDHGKTSLVAALTGVDTDTHPEEKQRGITIDLGFASFSDGEHRFAMIDAPGHQKYIGNLLAGVSGVDVGLLVVACDQGIQAQTLEHAAILQSLGVSKLIVAISRIDLSDESTRDELKDELDLFLADYGFHQIPIVSLSSVTGAGLDQLRSLLRDYAATADRTAPSIFRMPIDRVFTKSGRGCVVAGTLWSGSVAIGDHLQLSRTGDLLRVRDLEVHGESVTESSVGLRTAMNLAGVSSSVITRGDELVAEATHPTTRRMVVQLTMFRGASEIRCPTTVQLHTATTSCTVRIAGVKRIGSAETAVVVVDTEEPVVVTYAQQCLFRRPYPVGSFAGGRVLGCVEPGLRQTTRLVELGRRVSEGNAVERLVAWVDFHGELQVDRDWMQLQLGVAADDIRNTIDAAINSGSVKMPVDGVLVSDQAMKRIRGYVVKLLTHQAEATEDAWLAEQAVVGRASSTGSAPIIGWGINQLVSEHLLVRVNHMIAAASDNTVLSKKQRGRMERLLTMYSGARTPPTIKEAAGELETTIDSVASLIRFATQQRVLIDLGNGFFISSDTFRDLCRELGELFDSAPEQSVANIRDHWQMTRKHAIPLLEYCDHTGVTVRGGDTRVAGATLNEMLSEQTIEQD
jgi:selenocysteine-specific elongation factor